MLRYIVDSLLHKIKPSLSRHCSRLWDRPIKLAKFVVGLLQFINQTGSARFVMIQGPVNWSWCLLIISSICHWVTLCVRRLNVKIKTNTYVRPITSNGVKSQHLAAACRLSWSMVTVEKTHQLLYIMLSQDI